MMSTHIDLAIKIRFLFYKKGSLNPIISVRMLLMTIISPVAKPERKKLLGQK